MIQKIYDLPHLKEFTFDNLVNMITVLEAALPALMRREPGSVESTNGDLLSQVLSLLPRVEVDFFHMFCTMKSQDPNFRGFLHFLLYKCEIRKPLLPISDSKVRSPQRDPKKRERGSIQKTCEVSNGSAPASKCLEELSNAIKLLTNAVMAGGIRSVSKIGQSSCGVCGSGHGLAHCKIFKKLSIEEKRKTVERTGACRRCLQVGHFARGCKRLWDCIHEGCNQKHQSLLHYHFHRRNIRPEGAFHGHTKPNVPGSVDLQMSQPQLRPDPTPDSIVTKALVNDRAECQRVTFTMDPTPPLQSGPF